MQSNNKNITHMEVYELYYHGLVLQLCLCELQIA